MSDDLPAERYARGEAVLRTLYGEGAVDAAVTSVGEIAPDFGRYLVEFGFGDISTRPGLDHKERELVVLGALTALGDTKPQLAFHIGAALHSGLTATEIVEVLAHLELVVGFPRAQNALLTAQEVFADRGVKPEPVTPEPQADRFEFGKVKLEEIAGAHGFEVIRALDDIAPAIGRILVEYAWGEVYGRPGASVQQRQLATLGAMIAYGDTAPQIRTHLNIALRLGFQPQQLVEVVLQSSPYVGFPHTLNAIAAVRDVFAKQEIIL